MALGGDEAKGEYGGRGGETLKFDDDGARNTAGSLLRRYALCLHNTLSNLTSNCVRRESTGRKVDISS